MDSFVDLWHIVDDKMHKQIGETAHKVWIATIDPVDLTADEVILKVPSNFYRNVVVGRYGGDILKIINELTGLTVNLTVITDDDPERKENSTTAFHKANENDEYTFETFIVGNTNRFAHAASIAVTQDPGNNYNPLFIYGPSGNGKTHLLLAIGEKINKNFPGSNIVYIKGDQFTNELVEAISLGKQIEFRNKYRYADVFLVDDVQFIGGREQTQEEFFHTFNALHQEKKQIVLTSDRLPKEIKTLEERLRSRFESGLLADIQPPELETRIAIVKQKALMLGLNMGDDVAEYIAIKLKNSIRQLEGVVKKLHVVVGMSGERLNITAAQNAIKDVLSDVQPVPLTIEKIIGEVARGFEVNAEDIISSRRTAPLSLARQVAMYVIREVINLSYEAIGKEFSDRDHTTVIYACQKVEEKMKTQKAFESTVQDIIQNIKS